METLADTDEEYADNCAHEPPAQKLLKAEASLAQSSPPPLAELEKLLKLATVKVDREKARVINDGRTVCLKRKKGWVPPPWGTFTFDIEELFNGEWLDSQWVKVGDHRIAFYFNTKYLAGDWIYLKTGQRCNLYHALACPVNGWRVQVRLEDGTVFFAPYKGFYAQFQRI